jgi:hypothetical protein
VYRTCNTAVKTVTSMTSDSDWITNSNTDNHQLWIWLGKHTQCAAGSKLVQIHYQYSRIQERWQVTGTRAGMQWQQNQSATFSHTHTICSVSHVYTILYAVIPFQQFSYQYSHNFTSINKLFNWSIKNCVHSLAQHSILQSVTSRGLLLPQNAVYSYLSQQIPVMH